MSDRWLSPSEMAARLGVTPKALRVFEREGLVSPLRTSGGWRAYGPDQVARLHQVMVLRGLGLPLKQIRDMLDKGLGDLASVLAIQRESLAARRAAADRAIQVLDAALRKLGAGEALSFDDLNHLTKETLMEPSMQALKARLDAVLAERQVTDEADALVQAFAARLPETGRTKAQLFEDFKGLAAEAADLAGRCAEDSEDAKAFARRYLAVFAPMRPSGVAANPVAAHLREAMDKVLSNPLVTAALPFDVAGLDFLRRVIAGMRERGELPAAT